MVAANVGSVTVTVGWKPSPKKGRQSLAPERVTSVRTILYPNRQRSPSPLSSWIVARVSPAGVISIKSVSSARSPAESWARADGTARREHGGGLHMLLGHLASTTRYSMESFGFTEKQTTWHFATFFPRDKNNRMQLLQ